MVISTASFSSDFYFHINHDENSKNLQNNDGGIIFVHFLLVSYQDSCMCVTVNCVCVLCDTYIAIIIVRNIFYIAGYSIMHS